MSAYQQMIQQQFEEGLRQIEQTANQLMREIAGEVWRAAGGDKQDTQATILEAISRDQGIRSLIAHTDERYQSIAMRTARLEDTMNNLADGVRDLKEQLAGAGAFATGEGSPIADVQHLHVRLDEVTRLVAVAMETLAQRDLAIAEVVQQRVREHGLLVSTETARITEAMEAYVQQGVSAMGQLAGGMEAQIETIARRAGEIAGRDDQIEERLRRTLEEAIARRDTDVAERIDRAVKDELARLDERLGVISERVAVDTTSVTEAVTHLTDLSEERSRSHAELLALMHDRVGMETRDVLNAVQTAEARTAERLARIDVSAHDAAVGSARELNRTLEARFMGMAKLVRSDSMALREELVRSTAAKDEAVARVLEERLGHVSETLTTATSWMVEELSRRIREEVAQTIGARLDDAVETMARTVSERASQAADLAIRERLDDVSARMHAAMQALERTGAELAQAHARTEDIVSRGQARTEEVTLRAQAQMEEITLRAQAQAEETMTRTMDARFAGLAKMVRSDNESLARQIVADQDATKQALRAMKELQASLPADVIGSVQRRMDDLAESVAKSQEMLAQRIDRMASKVGERTDNDIQIVIDRMGDAMHALASLGRSPEAPANPSRIELE